MTASKNMLIVFILLFTPILILGIALLLTLVPLPPPLPMAGSHARNLLAAILTGILGLVWATSLVIYLVASFLMAGRAFESTFTSRGLTAGSYLGLGRQYQGSIDGRQVEAQYSPGRMIQNGLLNIHIQTDTNLRMAVGVNRPLLDCITCQQVEGSSYGLDDINVYAEDIPWAQNLLAESPNVELIRRLMDKSEKLGMREIYMQPGRIWLHARPSAQFDANYAQIWLQLLLDLSRAIEKSH
ncbi:MAG: hypothetical protein A2X25_09160 [Chloroflexi bacterium GWB2_49_20]|nr:MAG: hypothetical protein A2X25_09160 [Chloroflexi bacterium GWB2_49_20]OGN79402.1 MAG: hypothetical protein A2X26_04865 [Chloroflexi bacterium GWC2_49_37]OGN82828.1 MAG: hypothetical protein A2X27_07830 [Chloroflexi bacterium GWD2_49_16]HCC79730.1 hypothetical protein [Anaerolineae bacterium]HCM97302.1 hypothetical protein [Anaerolineae bacterium]